MWNLSVCGSAILCLTGPFIVTPDFSFLLVTTSCLPDKKQCSGVLIAHVSLLQSSFRRMFTGHSPNSFVALCLRHLFVQVFQNLLPPSLFPFDLSISYVGALAILQWHALPWWRLSHHFSWVLRLFLGYYKNHTTLFWERECKCTPWPSHHWF